MPNLDPHTIASRPSNVKIDVAAYLGCHPKLFLISIVGVAAGVGLLLYGKGQGVYLAVGLPLLLIGSIPYLYVQSVIGPAVEQGDTCPAILLDKKDGKIAVLAEMSTAPGKQVPAIKIMHAPVLGRVHTPKEDRGRLTAICTYRGADNAEHWEDIVPVPVICVTNEKVSVERSLQLISEEEWKYFETKINQLTTTEPGLYFLT